MIAPVKSAAAASCSASSRCAPALIARPDSSAPPGPRPALAGRSWRSTTLITATASTIRTTRAHQPPGTPPLTAVNSRASRWPSQLSSRPVGDGW